MFCLRHIAVVAKFIFDPSVQTMSLAELAQLTADLEQSEPPSPRTSKLHDEVADLRAAVQEMKDSHNVLLKHVTDLARHVS
jgi:hypothetical protein